MLSLGDKTGIADVVIASHVFERDRIVLTRNCFLGIEGPLQNLDSAIHVTAQRSAPLDITSAYIRFHDNH